MRDSLPIGSLISTVIFLLSLSLGAAAPFQTTPKGQESKRSVRVGLPSSSKYRCDESKASCKSFLQLVDSGDEGFSKILHGSLTIKRKHYAYVCLEEERDLFNIIEFDEPRPDEFEAYPYIVVPDDRSVSPFKADATRLTFESLDPMNDHRDLLKMSAAKEAWFEDHSDLFTYSLFGSVAVKEFRNGIESDSDIESGKWRRDANAKSSAPDSEPTFEGEFYWLESYNHDHDSEFAAIDLKDRLHASITASQIMMHYDFANKHNSTTHYSLTIQRSTGRFVESTSAEGNNWEDTGSCVIVKDIHPGGKK